MVVVQVSEIRLVGSILTTSPDASVIPAPFGTEPLPLVPGLFHGIVPVSRTEDLSQVVSHITFATVADIAQYVALQVGGASLETGAGKHFADDDIKSLETVRAYESDSRNTSLVKVIEHLSPAKGAFRRLVVDAENLSGLVLLDCKDYIESLSINAALAVDLDVDAVDEHYRIIARPVPASGLWCTTCRQDVHTLTPDPEVWPVCGDGSCRTGLAVYGKSVSVRARMSCLDGSRCSCYLTSPLPVNTPCAPTP